jgi:hypothetical protein
MNRLAAVLVTTAFALVLSAAAAAKGPAAGSLTGPGLDGPIQLTGLGEPGSVGTLGRVVEHGGFFAALGGSDWGTLLDQQPAGDLGPRYTATFVMRDRADRTVRQHLYPYARPLPVTYTPPGQKPFGTLAMGDGWFVADERLKAALVEAGLPPAAPATPSDRGFELPQQRLLVTAGIAAVLALAGAALLGRRRPLTTAR